MDAEDRIRDLVQADAFRATGRDGWRSVLQACRARTFRPVLTLRLCQWTSRSRSRTTLHRVARLAHRRACRTAGIDLPWTVSAGPGLLINHGWGLVVSGRAVLGANVTLMHGATIGQADRISRTGDRESRFPSVGDNVWIGPHAVVAGARVGSGARVLGGAMVTEDVPPAAMVGGNPGSLLRRDVVPDVVNPVPR